MSMGLRFADIHHNYGPVSALRGITLDAQKGEILSLLGRSGCGKSTLLKLAAGILPVQSGAITLDAAPLAAPSYNPPPEKRSVGLVFQDSALFPHLTVAENIGFGLKDRTRRSAIIKDLLEQIDMSDMADRYPHTLSGGQQQRVAVARALAPVPDVLLMDEPFASIDISLRRQLREETRRLVKSRKCATILVTHDPEEAIEIADKIAVMEDGRITQHGTGRELHDHPTSLFVGLMAGSGAVLTATQIDDQYKTNFGTFDTTHAVLANGSQSSKTVEILIQPHRARLISDPDGLTVTDVRHTGRSQIVTVSNPASVSLLLEVAPDPVWQTGQRVTIRPNGQPWPAFSQ